MGKDITYIRNKIFVPDRFGFWACCVCVFVLALVSAFIAVNGLVGNAYAQSANTVSIDPNFGTGIIDTLSVMQGEKVSLLPVPEKPFHTFAGWFEDEALTRPFLIETDTVHQSMTLFGKWKKNTFTATFVDPRFINDATRANGVIHELTQEFGTSFSFPLLDDADAENFKGWSTHMHGHQIENSTKPNLMFDFPEQNVTFYAVWAFDFWAFERPRPQETIPLTVRFNFQYHVYTFYYDLSPTVINQFRDKKTTNEQIIDLPTMLGITAMNNGYTSYSFGCWALTPTTADNTKSNTPTFRDGQTIALANWTDFAVDGVLEFYAVWKQN